MTFKKYTKTAKKYPMSASFAEEVRETIRNLKKQGTELNDEYRTASRGKKNSITRQRNKIKARIEDLSEELKSAPPAAMSYDVVMTEILETLKGFEVKAREAREELAGLLTSNHWSAQDILTGGRAEEVIKLDIWQALAKEILNGWERAKEASPGSSQNRRCVTRQGLVDDAILLQHTFVEVFRDVQELIINLIPRRPSTVDVQKAAALAGAIEQWSDFSRQLIRLTHHLPAMEGWAQLSAKEE
jgi:hypothetical protein